jgi:hypothetical protein
MGCEKVDYSTELKDFFRRRSAIRIPSIGWTISQPILELSRMVE